ncbi:MAG: hypothetical protein H6Q61_645 [Firmicutes bacterium]|nr:hypothetical protein [Bacillota bacterium]
MDDFMMDFELLNMLEDTDKQEETRREESVSPYRSAQHEAFGQFVAMFQGFDDLLAQWEEELDAQEAAEAEGSESL